MVFRKRSTRDRRVTVLVAVVSDETVSSDERRDGRKVEKIWNYFDRLFTFGLKHHTRTNGNDRLQRCVAIWNVRSSCPTTVRTATWRARGGFSSVSKRLSLFSRLQTASNLARFLPRFVRDVVRPEEKKNRQRPFANTSKLGIPERVSTVRTFARVTCGSAATWKRRRVRRILTTTRIAPTPETFRDEIVESCRTGGGGGGVCRPSGGAWRRRTGAEMNSRGRRCRERFVAGRCPRENPRRRKNDETKCVCIRLWGNIRARLAPVVSRNAFLHRRPPW